MLLTEIRRNQKLAAKRNPMYDRNRFAKFLIYLFTAFWAAYLVLIGVSLSFAFEEDIPGMEPYDALDSVLILFLLIDFLIRFLFPTPAQEIKPYLLLPVSRQRLINTLLVQVGLKLYNLFWLFLFVPFAALTAARYFGVAGVTGYAVGIWLLMTANAYWSILVRALARQHTLWLLLPAAVYGLMALLEFVPSQGMVSQFFMWLGEAFLRWNLLAHAGVLAVIVLLLLVNCRVQTACIYSELGRKEDSRVRHFSRYGYLERFGMTGEYMRLELRMIFRNKTPRKNFQMMCIVLVLFAAMLFGITQESTQSVYSIQLYSIYCFTGFAVSILTRIMAYEGNYLDGLMVRRESLLSLFRSKYYFHCLLLVFPLVLLLPSIIWSGLPAGLVVSQLFLTAGIILPLIMQLAWINRKTAPLDASIMGKGQWNSPYQMVIVFFAFFFPILFSNLLFLVLSENMAYLVCTLLGMAGIAAQPLWMRYLYRQVIRKKYDILTNLRDTR